MAGRKAGFLDVCKATLLYHYPQVNIVPQVWMSVRESLSMSASAVLSVVCGTAIAIGQMFITLCLSIFMVSVILLLMVMQVMVAVIDLFIHVSNSRYSKEQDRHA